MTKLVTIFKKIAQNLENNSTDQQSITTCVADALKGCKTVDFVEGHNLAIKIQRAFEENIFKNVLDR